MARKGRKTGKNPPNNSWSIRWHGNTRAQCDRWREQPWSEAHSCSWALWSWRGAEEVNGPARTCKDSWMKPSIFYRSLGPDTASEAMREQRSRAISTKPVTFFLLNQNSCQRAEKWPVLYPSLNKGGKGGEGITGCEPCFNWRKDKRETIEDRVTMSPNAWDKPAWRLPQ